MTDEMIVEAIRSVKLNSPQNLGAASGVGATAPVANPEAVSRFEAAMATPPVDGTAQVGKIPFADQVAETWRSAQESHQGMLHRISALSEMSAQDGVSSAQLARLQYEVMNLSFQQEVVAKVADKASNAVQTLIKNQ